MTDDTNRPSQIDELDHLSALPIDDKFWLEHLDKLNQRFNAWVAK